MDGAEKYSPGQTLNAIEGVGRECGGLVRDNEQRDSLRRQTTNRYGICSTAKGQLPVVTNDGVDTDTSAEGDGACPATVNECGALGWVELLLSGACGTTCSTYNSCDKDQISSV